MAAGGECACVKGALGPRVEAGRRCGEERLRLCDCFGALHVVTYASLRRAYGEPGGCRRPLSPAGPRNE